MSLSAKFKNGCKFSCHYIGVKSTPPLEYHITLHYITLHCITLHYITPHHTLSGIIIFIFSIISHRIKIIKTLGHWTFRKRNFERKGGKTEDCPFIRARPENTLLFIKSMANSFYDFFETFSNWKGEDTFKQRIGFRPLVLEAFSEIFPSIVSKHGRIVLLHTLNFIRDYDRAPYQNWKNTNENYFPEHVSAFLNDVVATLPPVLSEYILFRSWFIFG